MKNCAVVLISLFIFLSSPLNAQNDIWQDIRSESIVAKSTDKRVTKPTAFRAISMDFVRIKKLLKQAPDRFTKTDQDAYLEIYLPMPDGTEARFKIEEASIMHPELAAKFPEIKSYAGKGIDDPTATIRMSVGKDGFHAQILSGISNTIFIDPYFFKDHKYYMSFYKNDLVKSEHDHFECHNHDEVSTEIHSHVEKAGDCDFRTYKLAVACTGEYTDFHGGTVSDASSAINTTMTRVNGIYEREFAITMELVADNDDVIYTDGSTDPYSNNNGSAMLGQNQSTLDTEIGNANYDIGHVFSTGGGGIAQLNSPCVTGNKAKGVTGSGSPTGDSFDVDYVAHEMGHQFGGRHTFNNSCSGNRSSTTSYEPGSGSTIMAYAGICSPNVQSNSDDYFHAISLQEIGNFVTTGNGANCPVTTSTSNSAPTVSAPSDKVIPTGTPFFLTADGDDDDSGDVLTYTWEQWDRQIADMPPEDNSTDGPSFRSIDPSTSDTRYFPNLSDLAENTTPTWEVVSTEERDYNFRVTVRDNSSDGGCTEEDNIKVESHETGDPFMVTVANTVTEWDSNTSETITWDVAGTTASPISCSDVDILLSLDGGLTYTVTLASDTPNDGSETITVPNNPTGDGRIMVVCSDNIFFDINDANIGIDMMPNSYYCQATYNNLSCTSDDYIDDVIFEGISNTGTGCALDDNYSDYTSQIADVDLNMTYTMTVRASTEWDQYMVAFVDFNRDGDLLDSGEFFDIGLVNAGDTETVDIVVPAGATAGNTRMRVMSQYGNNAIAQADVCANFGYGEIEDYTVNVLGGCPTTETVTMDFNNGDVEDIEADVDIIATNNIYDGANIIYDAGSNVDLNIGFFVEAGAVFEAFIDGCGNTLKEDKVTESKD